jgi:cell division protein ZapA (FtsZ GTPase activity inhibitor)
MNDKVDIEIYKRKITVEIEGLTPIEINALARKVDERMQEISALTGVIDSSKLGILTALHFAADQARIVESQDTQTRFVESKVEELSYALQQALASEEGDNA